MFFLGILLAAKPSTAWNAQHDMMDTYITVECNWVANSKEATMWQQAIKCSLCVIAEVLETPKALNECWRVSLVSMTQAAWHIAASLLSLHSWTWLITVAIFHDSLTRFLSAAHQSNVWAAANHSGNWTPPPLLPKLSSYSQVRVAQLNSTQQHCHLSV